MAQDGYRQDSKTNRRFTAACLLSCLWLGSVPLPPVCASDEPTPIMFWTGSGLDRRSGVPSAYEVFGAGWKHVSDRGSPGEPKPSRLLAAGQSLTAGSYPPEQESKGDYPGRVKIVDRSTYYDVVLDFTGDVSRKDICAAYGREIKRVLPEYESLLDSYLAQGTFSRLVYAILLRRTRQLRKQVQAPYVEEIEGLASAFSGGSKNRRGDGKISRDEIYLLNFLGDVCRLSACSAVAVYGDRSATHHPIAARNLDWPDGKKNEMARLQAVVTIKDGERVVTTIGALGYQAVCTGVNADGVFAGVLDAGTGEKFTAKRRRSYLFDLRQALEEKKSVDGVVDFMTEPSHRYSFNHLILIADEGKAGVLENNFSGKGLDMHRALRTGESELNPGIEWNLKNSVGAVNWFTLKGNHDNRIDPLDKHFTKRGKTPPDKNSLRWQSLKEEIGRLGERVDFDGLKHVLTASKAGGSMYKGDLFNRFTMQTVVFDPHSRILEAAFRPRDGARLYTPRFERLSFPSGKDFVPQDSGDSSAFN